MYHIRSQYTFPNILLFHICVPKGKMLQFLYSGRRIGRFGVDKKFCNGSNIFPSKFRIGHFRQLPELYVWVYPMLTQSVVVTHCAEVSLAKTKGAVSKTELNKYILLIVSLLS